MQVCFQYATQVWNVLTIKSQTTPPNGRQNHHVNALFCSDEMEKIKIPKDMDDAKALGTVLSKYKDTYYTQVLVAYFATYVLYPSSRAVDRSASPFFFVLLQVYI